MKLAVVLVSCITTLAFSHARTEAEPVPEWATGIWSVGTDCGGGSTVAMVNSRTAIIVETRNDKLTVGIAEAKFVAGSHVLAFEGKTDELILPPLKQLRECRALPGPLPVAFAEAINLFPRLDELDEACLEAGGMDSLCAAVGFDVIDITGDGRISRAEISRTIRAAAFFVGYALSSDDEKSAFVPFENLLLSWLAGSAMGPTIAGNIVGSYDYDGDGFLSLSELMQDRAPEEGLQSAISSMAGKLAPDTLAAILRSANGILEVLP